MKFKRRTLIISSFDRLRIEDLDLRKTLNLLKNQTIILINQADYILTELFIEIICQSIYLLISMIWNGKFAKFHLSRQIQYWRVTWICTNIFIVNCRRFGKYFHAFYDFSQIAMFTVQTVAIGRSTENVRQSISVFSKCASKSKSKSKSEI